MPTRATCHGGTKVNAGKIDHDKIGPFPQPNPVTISEKAAVKFKPQLNIADGCGLVPGRERCWRWILHGRGVKTLRLVVCVVWIDNPDFATPAILGLSTSTSDDEKAPAPDFGILDGVTPLLYRSISEVAGQPMLDYSSETGDVQPLIMWEQLTDAAREPLNTFDFGDAQVPFNDANFEEKLKKAWPF
ncbi:Necrosis inducing protein [Phytophthora cactorum]|nr:Necrosis inducing protein [Phytophthora cactorum]